MLKLWGLPPICNFCIMLQALLAKAVPLPGRVPGSPVRRVWQGVSETGQLRER